MHLCLLAEAATSKSKSFSGIMDVIGKNGKTAVYYDLSDQHNGLWICFVFQLLSVVLLDFVWVSAS